MKTIFQGCYFRVEKSNTNEKIDHLAHIIWRREVRGLYKIVLNLYLFLFIINFPKIKLSEF